METTGKSVLDWFVVLAAFVMLVLGAAGMTVSFLFLWSPSQVDVMGAGMAFLAGASMMGSGLIALAIVATRKPSPN